ncbi:unnamed protein product, partial [Mesorhabditis spiculigera]
MRTLEYLIRHPQPVIGNKGLSVARRVRGGVTIAPGAVGSGDEGHRQVTASVTRIIARFPNEDELVSIPTRCSIAFRAL